MADLTLNEKLRGIGFRLTSVSPERRSKAPPVDIERALLEAILQSADGGRLASLLFSWLKVHGAYVNVERLAKLAKSYPEKTYPAIRLLSGYAAFALEHCGQKWKKLTRRSKEPLYLYPKEITDSAVEMKGSVDYLAKFGVIVPNGSIRVRDKDVLSPDELIRVNSQYRNRYLYGPSWRADIVTAIEGGAESPSEVMKRVECSYEPAYRVFKEYRMAKRAA